MSLGQQSHGAVAQHAEAMIVDSGSPRSGQFIGQARYRYAAPGRELGECVVIVVEIRLEISAAQPQCHREAPLVEGDPVVRDPVFLWQPCVWRTRRREAVVGVSDGRTGIDAYVRDRDDYREQDDARADAPPAGASDQ